jgi:DNA-directed RNA polymerase subunit beta'
MCVLSATHSGLSVANGEPVLVPTQDMVVGALYVSRQLPMQSKLDVHYYFASFKDVLQAYEQGVIPLNISVWVRFSYEQDGVHVSSIETSGSHRDVVRFTRGQNGEEMFSYLCTSPGRILLNQVLN